MASIPRSLACVKPCGLPPPRVFCCGAAVTEHPGGSARKDRIANPEGKRFGDTERLLYVYDLIMVRIYIHIYIAHTDTYVINISYVNCFTTFMYVRCMLMYSCFFLNIMEVSRMGSNLEGLPEVPEHPTWGCHGDNGSCWYGL